MNKYTQSDLYEDWEIIDTRTPFSLVVHKISNNVITSKSISHLFA